MNLLRDLDEAKKQLTGKKLALTIGNFDGVHLGHQALLKDLKRVSENYGLTSMVLTFDPHPRAILQPDHPFGQRLFPVSDLQLQMQKLGVEILWVESFTERLSQQSPEAFIQEYLNAFKIKYLLVGHDFHFGKGREGKIEHLLSWAQNQGVQIKVFHPHLEQNQRVSTTLIRQLLLKGEVQNVSEYLGRPYQVQGQVVKGHGKGSDWGFPTANINISAPIQNGVYITEVKVDKKTYPAVTNVGLRPTVNKDWDILNRNIESHLLDQSLDLYTKNIEVNFLEFIRPEKKFDTLPDLHKQIHKDIELAKQYFGLG